MTSGPFSCLTFASSGSGRVRVSLWVMDGKKDAEWVQAFTSAPTHPTYVVNCQLDDLCIVIWISKSKYKI